MVVLVTGGRHFTDEAVVYEALDHLNTKHRFTRLRHGNARGADSLARDWAIDHYILQEPFQAEWDVYGRAAGAIRNTMMLNHDPVPGLVVAFPGGVGTRDCTVKALHRRIPAVGVQKTGGSWVIVDLGPRQKCIW